MGCIGLSCKLSIESNETCVVKFEFSPLETLIVHHEYSNVSSTEEEKPLVFSNKDVTQQKQNTKSPPKPPKQTKTKIPKKPTPNQKKKPHTQNSQKASQLCNTSKYMTLLLHKNNKVH